MFPYFKREKTFYIILFVTCIIFQGCVTSISIQKRKFSKGFHIQVIHLNNNIKRIQEKPQKNTTRKHLIELPKHAPVLLPFQFKQEKNVLSHPFSIPIYPVKKIKHAPIKPILKNNPKRIQSLSPKEIIFICLIYSQYLSLIALPFFIKLSILSIFISLIPYLFFLEAKMLINEHPSYNFIVALRGHTIPQYFLGNTFFSFIALLLSIWVFTQGYILLPMLSSLLSIFYIYSTISYLLRSPKFRKPPHQSPQRNDVNKKRTKGKK